jgi:hypothetical protein
MKRSRNIKWLGSHLVRRHAMRHEAEIFGVVPYKVDIPAATESPSDECHQFRATLQ